MGENRDVIGVLARGVVPALGMAMVWPLLRYASFFMLLYPVGLRVPVGRGGVSAHGVFLAALAVAVVVACGLRARLRGVVSRRGIVAAMGCLASLGALVALAVKGSLLPSGALWLSIAATAVGFLALYVGWGTYMVSVAADGEALKAVLLLGISLALSFVLFSRLGVVGSLADGQVAAVLMPAGASALWLCARPPVRLVGDGGWLPVHRVVTPLLVAVGVFLIVGSAVRGIVDLQVYEMPGRQFSMEASLLVAAVALGVAGQRRWAVRHGRPVRSPDDAMVLLAVGYWIAFALAFIGGLFVFLSTDSKRLGGDVVVVSRTLMELVFWLLLCHAAATRRVPAPQMFLTCGVTVEVISWAVSYVLIPLLAGAPSTSPMLRDDTFVLAVVFGAAAAMMVGWGAYWVFKQPRVAVASIEPAAPQVAEPALLQAEGLLTEREATVARLYARGYSLQKVADELRITKSTAQSHIKHVYRKLGVHSRDELIELFDAPREGRGVRR